MNTLFRQLPSVDRCLKILSTDTIELYKNIPRVVLRNIVTSFLDTIRSDIKQGIITDCSLIDLTHLYPLLITYIKQNTKSQFRKVINGTGVILHTNLGRAVLADVALKAIYDVCSGYSNLEMDLETGERGSRYSHVIDLLCTLTGAESAIVVNNNAAAVLLCLDTLCKGKEVIVSRGQLVEIGGSFRIPEVMERSGAQLKEVGCTNRVHLSDYEKAIAGETAAIMRVHTSNYRLIGFHSEVSLSELVTLSKKYGLLCIEDLGSGSFLDFSQYSLPGEPTVQAVIASGVDVVTFSGDKVLGGPQSGIIVGKKAVISSIASNPLNRALRIDKMTLAALEATLTVYLDSNVALKKIPTLAMMTLSPSTLERRAKRLAARLRQKCASLATIMVMPGYSQVGGGAFPEYNLQTSLVCIKPKNCSSEHFKFQLLKIETPILGRLEEGYFCIDLRTIVDKDVPLVISNILQVINKL